MTPASSLRARRRGTFAVPGLYCCRARVGAAQLDVDDMISSSSDQPLARAYLAEDGGVIDWRDLPRASYQLVLERDSVPIAEVTLAPRATGGDGFAMPRDWRSL